MSCSRTQHGDPSGARTYIYIYMKVYARFDEILSKTLKDIKETKRYGRTAGGREYSIHTHKHSLGGGA